MNNIEQVLEVAPHKAEAVRPPTTHHKTIQVRLTRHAGHFWKSWDELMSDILLWTQLHRWAKAGRSARTYIQQVYFDTGYSLEDLPGAMDDRDWWWERIRDICAADDDNGNQISFEKLIWIRFSFLLLSMIILLGDIRKWDKTKPKLVIADQNQREQRTVLSKTRSAWLKSDCSEHHCTTELMP